MKVAIFAVEFKAKDFDDSYYSDGRVHKEFQLHWRCKFFNELVNQVRTEGVKLVVLPGGFFRTDYPDQIERYFEKHPPKITVFVGRDNTAGSKLEVLAISPNGTVKKRVVEVYYKYKKVVDDKSRQDNILESTKNRCCRVDNKKYAIISCGDVFIPSIRKTVSQSNCDAAFVLAHYSATRFTASMLKLEMPTFLSQHVKDPHNTVNYAYNGKFKKNDPKPKEIPGEYKEFKWIVRIYSV